MTIELQKLIKDLKLNDEQTSALSEAQKKLDDQLKSAIDQEASGLKNKNSELIQKLKDAKDKAIPENFDMDGYKNYVKNIDKIEKEKLEAEEKALIATKNWDKLKNDMTNNHEQTVNQLKTGFETDYNELKNSFDTVLIENAALKEIEAAEGSQVLLMPHIEKHITTYKDANGEFLTKVVGPDGKDRMNNETGELFTVKDLVAEFQANKDFSGAFPIQNAGSGGDANIQGTNYNSTNNPFDKKGKHYNLTEQAKLRKTNPALAKSLAEAANK